MCSLNAAIPSAILVLFLSLGERINVSGLDCFNCQGIENIDNCHTTQVCLPSEHCYTETYLNNSGLLVYTLGCREKEFCVGLDQSFGRKRQSSPNAAIPGCLQCCTLHGCNKNLCPVRHAPQPINGDWSSWGPWSRCDTSCGIGLKGRYRSCNNPPPSQTGRLCLGDAKDVKICQIDCSAMTTPSLKPTTTTTAATTTPKPTTTTTQPTPPTGTSPKYVTHDLTQAPGGCKDLIDCSGYYRPDACVGAYAPWAHRYCPVHCGFCPTPSPEPCVDTIDNCNEYQDDLCTNQDFWQWRESHCRKWCKLC